MHASFQSLALTSVDEDAKRTFHEAMLTTEEIITDVKARVGELEYEEPQYKGF